MSPLPGGPHFYLRINSCLEIADAWYGENRDQTARMDPLDGSDVAPDVFRAECVRMENQASNGFGRPITPFWIRINEYQV